MAANYVYRITTERQDRRGSRWATRETDVAHVTGDWGDALMGDGELWFWRAIGTCRVYGRGSSTVKVIRTSPDGSMRTRETFERLWCSKALANAGFREREAWDAPARVLGEFEAPEGREVVVLPGGVRLDLAVMEWC